MRSDAKMLQEATAREICAKVQKMRKEAGLKKEDKALPPDYTPLQPTTPHYHLPQPL